MTTLPISMPYVFANVTTTQRLAYLDADFATLTNAINGIGNGSVALANVNITGGNVAPTSNSVPLSALQATGTLTAQHYLRGDGTWSGIASPAGGTVTSVNVNGGTTGFIFTGGPIDTSGNITMSGSYTGNISISQLENYGTLGNVLTSNGSAWISQAAPSGSGFSNMQTYTSGTGTWTIPAGVTKCKITVIGGGGAGGAYSTGCGVSGGGGGGGGTAIKYFTGLTPTNTLSYTVGAAGGTSSVSSGTQTITTISATGGSSGGSSGTVGDGGAGGLGSGGTLNIQGGGGSASILASASGAGGSSTFGGGGRGVAAAGVAGGAYGGGGSGAGQNGLSAGAGAAGVVIIEY